jgi:hypothetical protein
MEIWGRPTRLTTRGPSRHPTLARPSHTDLPALLQRDTLPKPNIRRFKTLAPDVSVWSEGHTGPALGGAPEENRMTDLYKSELAVVSRLFSPSVIREMARKGKSPLFARLVTQSDLMTLMASSKPVGNLFEAAFTYLQQDGCRNEYIYKAALIQRILFGRHSLQTASMLCEFRVGECKADMAILNGTATVYEVKSERDSLARLERQIESYAKVFAKVYVVAAEGHVEAVRRSVPADIGVLLLNKRMRISTVQEAADLPDRTSPGAIFDSIRTGEAQTILRLHGVAIPSLPNISLNAALRELFTKLTPREAHHGMVQVLKKTRNLLALSDLISQLPNSLHAAALSVPLRKLDHSRLVAAVNTPLTDALSWA